MNSGISTKRHYELAEVASDGFPIWVNKHYELNHLLHSHDFIELVIVERGRGVHFTKDSRRKIVPGDVFVIPVGMEHGYENVELLDSWNIIFDLELLKPLMPDLKHMPGFYTLFVLEPNRPKLAEVPLELDVDALGVVRQLSRRIASERRERREGYRSACILALGELVLFLSREASGGERDNASIRLAEVLGFMERNCKRELKLEELSGMMNMSPRNFQRLFRQYLGTNPFAHLLHIRLQRARRLLEAGKMNISEIAAEAGFSDGAYFTRQFRKVFGLTPSAYRGVRHRDS
jgi:AraC-like DNA-binding protein